MTKQPGLSYTARRLESRAKSIAGEPAPREACRLLVMYVVGRVMPAGLFRTVRGVVQVAFRNMRMVPGLFMIAGLMVLCGGLVMFSGVFMMLRCFAVVLHGIFRTLGTLLETHTPITIRAIPTRHWSGWKKPRRVSARPSLCDPDLKLRCARSGDGSCRVLENPARNLRGLDRSSADNLTHQALIASCGLDEAPAIDSAWCRFETVVRWHRECYRHTQFGIFFGTL